MLIAGDQEFMVNFGISGKVDDRFVSQGRKVNCLQNGDLGNLPISAVDPESLYSKRDIPGAAIFRFVLFERTIRPYQPENGALEGSALQQQACLEAEIAAAITVAPVKGLCGCGELLKRES
jgi:hypothetical protein